MAEAMKTLVAQVVARVEAGASGDAVEYAEVERNVSAATAAIEQEAHRAILQALDVDHERVTIEGKTHARVGRSESTYYTLAGPVVVDRALYREVGKRNAKVVDAVSLRAGVVEDGWLPQTAQAMAHQVQQGTSREAEEAARQVGRLPYSRSSFERVAHAVGALHVSVHAEVEQTLIEAFEVPKAARCVSASIDRVSLPMEEPRARPPGRPRKGAPKNPITRAYRMAYCATVTLHDQDGNALHTLRYGCMPQGEVTRLCQGLAGDVAALLRKRPNLVVVTLSDGAPEMTNLLSEHLNEETLGVPVHRLVDLWHLVEKLGKAARLIHGDAAAPVISEWKMLLCNRSCAVDLILADLHASGMRDDTIGDTRPVHDAITYLENHGVEGKRMDYATARRRGLPVGSGNVEATCKSLVAVRMKRPGSRWKETTGAHILHLRALALSDRWDSAISLTLRPLRTSVRAA